MPHYAIDGYNVIRSVDWLSAGALRDQRERLLKFIEDRRPQGRSAVTVVFDGRADVSGPRWPGTTRVIFADGDADPVLKNLVDDLPNPRDAVVVTDDRAIQRWVSAAGARVLSCREFLLAGKSAPPRRRSGLDAAGEEEINEELRRLWKLK